MGQTAEVTLGSAWGSYKFCKCNYVGAYKPAVTPLRAPVISRLITHVILAAIEAHEHTSTRAHEHTSTRAHEHTSTRAHEHTITRTHEHTDTRTHKHTNTRVHKHTNTRTHERMSTQTRPTWRPILANIKYVNTKFLLLDCKLW